MKAEQILLITLAEKCNNAVNVSLRIAQSNKNDPYYEAMAATLKAELKEVGKTTSALVELGIDCI